MCWDRLGLTSVSEQVDINPFTRSSEGTELEPQEVAEEGMFLVLVASRGRLVVLARD